MRTEATRATSGIRHALAAVALLAHVAASGAPSAAPPTSCGPDGEGLPEVVEGTFGPQDRGSYLLVPFAVPSGRTRVRVRLCHDQIDAPLPAQAQVKHTLDLGLYEPSDDGVWDGDEFRGWGGSSRLDVLVTPEGSNVPERDKTTVGFIPGPIPAGVWAAEIGVAAIAETGDADGRVAWRLEIFTAAEPSDTDEPWMPAPYDQTPADPRAGWYTGDVHVHAIHSNPNDATIHDALAYAFGDDPGAGLDFVTLSDYVTTRHWDEIGRFQERHPGKLVIRSAEVITYRGHINNHGSARWVDHRAGPIFRLEEDGARTLVRDAAANRPSAIFDAIHAGGGWTQVNHPTTFPSKVPPFALQCRGCSWEYSDQETDWAKVDAFEVQTGPAGYTDPKGNEPGPNPFTPLAIEWYDRLRRAGHDITAVGASDSHKAGAESLTMSPIGEATTVVYAGELSEAGIRRGILAGHAYVKFFAPNGPDLRFTATPAGGGAEKMMGDAIATNAATFTARVLGAAPTTDSPQARTLLVLRDGAPIASVPVADDDATFSFPAALGGDYRLQLMRGTAIEALSNPITLCTRGIDPRDPRCSRA